MNEFAEARKTMAKHLREDEGLRIAYESNIAMLLYDNFKVTLKNSNVAAKQLVDLIFMSES